jgi:hypothetical protein
MGHGAWTMGKNCGLRKAESIGKDSGQKRD